jgi:RpiR family transcriptional regulator, carbohydrate utilization regulator
MKPPHASTVAPFSGSEVSVLVRVQAIQADLRDSERKIAQYLLDDAIATVHLTITELADQTGTSEATVIRFARKLGYTGFAALKIALALELQESAPAFPCDLMPEDDTLAIARKVLDSSVAAVRDTRELLAAQTLDPAVDAILGARRLEVYGVGSSAAVAHAAYTQLIQIGIPVISVSDPHLQVLSAVQLGPEDVAFGISYSGSTRDTVEALEAAKTAGATCICLTHHARSPITRVADISLLAGGRARALEGLELGGQVADVAVIDALWVALAVRREGSRAALARGRKELEGRKRF